MEDKENKENFFRLGIRMDPELNFRLEKAIPELKRDARMRGERATKDAIVQEAIEFYLDFLEHKGDERVAAVQEIIAMGNEAARRTLKSCTEQLLEEVRAKASRKSKTGA